MTYIKIIMTDSSGPGIRREKCFSVGIVDLGDVEGFDSIPQENAIYGLKFNSGVYKRSIVPTSSPGREERETTFENLNNVDFNDAKIHTHYSLVKNAAGVWILVERPNWIIDIRITPTSVLSGRSNGLKKIMNNGSALLSYVPSKNKGVVIIEQDDDYYLSRNNEVGSNISVFLTMTAEFPDEKFKINKESSTAVIEVFLLNPPEDFVQVLPGLSLKWTNEAAQKVCGILLTNGTPSSSIPGVEFNASNTITFKRIVFSDDLYFRKLSYIDRTLSQNYLITIMP